MNETNCTFIFLRIDIEKNNLYEWLLWILLNSLKQIKKYGKVSSAYHPLLHIDGSDNFENKKKKVKHEETTKDVPVY